MKPHTPIEIILIEDDDHDAELTIRALQQYNLKNHIVRLENGQQAMDYFFGSDPFQKSVQETPNVILLDLRLPDISGLDILKELKKNTRTKYIPVVILTASNEEKDIQTCYDLGVNSYIAKPVNFDSFVVTMRTLGMYWLLLNRTP